MTTLKQLIERRVTACKKFTQSDKSELDKRLERITLRQWKDNTNTQKLNSAIRTAVKSQKE